MSLRVDLLRSYLTIGRILEDGITQFTMYTFQKVLRGRIQKITRRSMKQSSGCFRCDVLASGPLDNIHVKLMNYTVGF